MFCLINHIIFNTDMLKNSKGFTLIELLLVFGIVAIMAALAISQYNEYRRRANNITAITDLRNATTAVEAFIVSTPIINSAASLEIAPSGAVTASDGFTLEQVLPGFVPTRNVKLVLSRNAENQIVASASHCKGTSAGDDYPLFTASFTFNSLSSTNFESGGTYGDASMPIDGSGCADVGGGDGGGSGSGSESDSSSSGGDCAEACPGSHNPADCSGGYVLCHWNSSCTGSESCTYFWCSSPTSPTMSCPGFSGFSSSEPGSDESSEGGSGSGSESGSGSGSGSDSEEGSEAGSGSGSGSGSEEGGGSGSDGGGSSDVSAGCPEGKEECDWSSFAIGSDGSSFCNSEIQCVPIGTCNPPGCEDSGSGASGSSSF